jgi:hypothetical protein
MSYPPELARADQLLTAEELRQKYETEHPQHLRWMWRQAVVDDKTIRSYWDWVQAQLEEEEP